MRRFKVFKPEPESLAIVCSVNSEVPESLFVQKKFFSDLFTDCFHTSILDRTQTAAIPEKS